MHSQKVKKKDEKTRREVRTHIHSTKTNKSLVKCILLEYNVPLQTSTTSTVVILEHKALGLQHVVASLADVHGLPLQGVGDGTLGDVGATKTQVVPASVRGSVVHVDSSALCASQAVPALPALVHVLPVGAVAKTQVPAAALPSVRGMLVQVAASALCALQSVPPTGPVHVATEAWSISPCVKKQTKKTVRKFWCCKKNHKKNLHFPHDFYT